MFAARRGRIDARNAAIANRLGLADRVSYWNVKADPLHHELLERAWNPKRKAFTAAFGILVTQVGYSTGNVFHVSGGVVMA